jgi:hypothetical protein
MSQVSAVNWSNGVNSAGSSSAARSRAWARRSPSGVLGSHGNGSSVHTVASHSPVLNSVSSGACGFGGGSISLAIRSSGAGSPCAAERTADGTTLRSPRSKSPIRSSVNSVEALIEPVCFLPFRV